ncbi:MAG TPA: antibiotic biosynthesis monooxygenase [Candidatus Obscuribacter sp.]|nr:antibiotic biosynthesis monooxygenase [Candidatus Obscuribacter sp.]
MTKRAIIVEFKLHPGKQAEFDSLIKEHARRSKNEEPGCERFEVFQAVERDGSAIKDTVWLVELYRDAEAVDFHEKTERMPILGKAIESLVAEKRLIHAAMTQA